MKLQAIACLFGSLAFLALESQGYYYDPEQEFFLPDVKPPNKRQLAVHRLIASLVQKLVPNFFEDEYNHGPHPPHSTPYPHYSSTKPPKVISTEKPPFGDTEVCQIFPDNLIAVSQEQGKGCRQFCELVPGAAFFRSQPKPLSTRETPNCACLTSCPLVGLLLPRSFISGAVDSTKAYNTLGFDNSCIQIALDMRCEEADLQLGAVFTPISGLECASFCQGTYPGFPATAEISKDGQSCVCRESCTPVIDLEEAISLVSVSYTCQL